MEVHGRAYGLGALIALLVLVVCVVLALANRHLSDHMIEGLIGALAVAYLVP